MTSFSFHTVPEVVVGADSALSLGHLCQRQGITKPLLVTDAGLIEVGIIGPIAAARPAAAATR